MKEVTFLHQNSEKWQEFEALLKKIKSVNPDKLAEIYIILTDDLSYARTFYPGSKTELYLNILTSKIHQAIYNNKKEEKGRILNFWKKEQPILVKKYRIYFLYSLIIFSISILIGIISSANDDGFVQLILGEKYVKMTEQNIEKGDPMAVYKKMNQVEMFLGITLNNIMVSFYAFVMGVLFSFGTVLVLFHNGIMLGAFHYMFYEKGLLLTSVMSIWIHGTLEISAIIIAGGTGLIIGNSILFPGTYSRRKSFTRGARDGLKILIGIVPIFITAGFLEGFVTRYTDMPGIMTFGIIAYSLIFIIWYYIIYPIIYHNSQLKD